MIHVRNVIKQYETVRALDGVDLDIASGEAVALMGASGSGKRTLLNLLGGLDATTSGAIEVGGLNLEKLADAELSRFRREQLGFVFQFFHLLPTLTVLENTMLQGRLAGMDETALQTRATELLDRVGLRSRGGEKPDVLSGGQRQRIALARALVTRPTLLLADEPTGNLDSASSAEVLKLMSEMVRENKTTLILATHSAEAAGIAARIVRLKDGRIAG